jgi:hypothetical protein
VRDGVSLGGEGGEGQEREEEGLERKHCARIAVDTPRRAGWEYATNGRKGVIEIWTANCPRQARLLKSYER